MTARILVVDDIEANLRVLQAKLEAKYYSVSLAQSGQIAVQRAISELPDIILLDVMMPGMDGYEVCRQLKSNVRTRHIPIVMLTALTDRDDRLRGLEAGADDFLSKPVDDFALFARLEALARYNAVADELRMREAANPRTANLSETELKLLARPGSILVVDQDNHAARRVTTALKRVGHEAESWIDAQAAGVKMKDIDLIVFSLSNQRHDALKLLAKMKSLRESRDFSIIVTCDQSDHERAAQSLQIGASDIILTPLDMQELQARVSTQLKRKRFLQILRQRVDTGLELSVIDQLTGLYNRRYMLEHLQSWMQRAGHSGEAVSIVAFDIDHFKSVNDAFGHEAGDLVLQKFAERLRLNIRPKDIACRPGGEEFLVIMPETSSDLATQGAERIRHAIAAEPFFAERNNQSIHVTVSAGVASYSSEGELLADFLHRADQALYKAKQNGRNRTERLAA